MGTRCLTRIFEGDEELCTIYRHFDGYPDGMGVDLVAALEGKRMVNGYSSRSSLTRERAMNGAGRLAVALVSELDADVSIYPTGSKDVGEDYEYHVKCPDWSACTKGFV